MSAGTQDHMHMPLRRWCIILGLGIATVVCGTVGLVLYGRAHGHHAEGAMEIPQAFYHSLQMLLLHTPHLEHGPNWGILAGEFFGAATALGVPEVRSALGPLMRLRGSR